MADWVRTHFAFDIPMAILTLDNRAARQMGLSLPDLAEKGSPEEIEAVVYDLIEELRPDLSGGVLVGIQYELSRLQWEFTYAAKFLPKRKEGDELERISLIPQ